MHGGHDDLKQVNMTNTDKAQWRYEEIIRRNTTVKRNN